MDHDLLEGIEGGKGWAIFGGMKLVPFFFFFFGGGGGEGKGVLAIAWIVKSTRLVFFNHDSPSLFS